MTRTHDRVATARHEAAHVAGLVMFGRLPRRATADWPEPDIAGMVSPDLENEELTRANAREFMLMVLMGALVERTPGWPPEWPIDPAAAPASARSDARSLRALAEFADLDADGWQAIVDEARAIARSRDFGHLVRLIGYALELKEEFTAADLRWLLGPDLLTKYGLEEATCST